MKTRKGFIMLENSLEILDKLINLNRLSFLAKIKILFILLFNKINLICFIKYSTTFFNLILLLSSSLILIKDIKKSNKEYNSFIFLIPLLILIIVFDLKSIFSGYKHNINLYPKIIFISSSEIILFINSNFTKKYIFLLNKFFSSLI